VKLTYTLSPSDVLELNKIVYQRLAAKARTAKNIAGPLALNILAWMGIAYAAATYVSLRRKHPDLSSDLNELLVSFAVGVVLLIVGQLYQQRRLRESAFSEKIWLCAPQSLSATEGYLDVATDGASTRYDWSRFIECIEDRTKLYLFLDLSYAVVVPKSAVGRSEELDQFRVWAKSSNQTMEPTR
jgi:hypothetical protein